MPMNRFVFWGGKLPKERVENKGVEHYVIFYSHVDSSKLFEREWKEKSMYEDLAPLHGFVLWKRPI